MQSNYKRLGDYIRPVNRRNSDDSITELLGINIEKYFMPSVANVIGTDLSKYKIVEKDQFACNRMHVGRDYRIPIAKSDKNDKFIVSPAYDVFEIIDEEILLPDFLMLWFKRKEFDRNAWFYTDADVRGGLSWEAFTNIQFPLFSVEKQKELVAEYEAVEQRIRLNNTLCEKLEETAQTIYRHWFEDFEFPYSRHCEERGTSDEAISLNALPKVAESNAAYQRNNSHSMTAGYKSSDGEMVYSEELGKEIPKGWKVGKLGEIATVKSGFAFKSESWQKTGIPVIKIGSIFNNSIDVNSLDFVDSRLKIRDEFTAKGNDLIIAMTGATIGKIGLIPNFYKTFYVNQRVGLFNFKDERFKSFLYIVLQQDYLQNEITSVGGDSAQANISHNQIENFKILIANNDVLIEFCDRIKLVIDKIQIKKQQTQKLEELKSLLLGKMAVENIN